MEKSDKQPETKIPATEPVDPEPVDIEENVTKEQRAEGVDREALLAAQQAFENIPAGGVPGMPEDVLARARARVTAMLAAGDSADLVEGGPLGWNVPPIVSWSKEVDAPIAEARKQLALYFPDWAVAVWPTAVPQQIIDALKADTGRPESERLVELSKLHTIQIECTWMPDAYVQRRLAQGATLEDVKGPKVYQFIAPPYTCAGPPVLEDLMKHIGNALLEHGAVQRDPQEVLAERKQAEIDDAMRVLKEHGATIHEGVAVSTSATTGPGPSEPGPMTLEKWETMSEPEKLQWQKAWAAWEAYRSPGPPPREERPEPMIGTRPAEHPLPFVPPDVYRPSEETVRLNLRGNPNHPLRGVQGPNGAQPGGAWEASAYEFTPGQPPQQLERVDPEVEMINHLLGLFGNGWGRADIARVLDYVKSRLC